MPDQINQFTEYADRASDNPQHLAGEGNLLRAPTTTIIYHERYSQYGGREWTSTPTLAELVRDARYRFRDRYRDLIRNHRADHNSDRIPPSVMNDPEIVIAEICYSVTSHIAPDDWLMIALSAQPELLTQFPREIAEASRFEPSTEDQLSAIEIIEINAYHYIKDELLGLKITLDDELRRAVAIIREHGDDPGCPSEGDPSA